MSDRAVKLAWAAGFFDGEGCVSISRHRQRHYRLNAIVVQKSDVPIRVFADLWPQGYINITHRNQNKAGRVGYWRWQVGGTHAANMLTDILPYLVEKRDQAVLAIEFQDAFDQAKYKFGSRGLPDEVVAYRNKCAQQLSDMKRRAGAQTESLGALQRG